MTASTESHKHTGWSARFGWIVGGILGLLLGFAVTYGIEVLLRRAHTHDPTGIAARLSSVFVPVFFIAGALTGHAFGARGGARYKTLGVAAGVLIAALGWALLVLTR